MLNFDGKCFLSDPTAKMDRQLALKLIHKLKTHFRMMHALLEFRKYSKWQIFDGKTLNFDGKLPLSNSTAKMDGVIALKLIHKLKNYFRMMHAFFEF